MLDLLEKIVRSCLLWFIFVFGLTVGALIFALHLLHYHFQKG